MREVFLQQDIRLSIEMIHRGRGGPFRALVLKDREVVGRG